jgi:hypothetical protein
MDMGFANGIGLDPNVDICGFPFHAGEKRVTGTSEGLLVEWRNHCPAATSKAIIGTVRRLPSSIFAPQEMLERRVAL